VYTFTKIETPGYKVPLVYLLK